MKGSVVDPLSIGLCPVIGGSRGTLHVPELRHGGVARQIGANASGERAPGARGCARTEARVDKGRGRMGPHTRGQWEKTVRRVGR